MKTFFGLVHGYEQGDAAVRALLKGGFESESINAVLLETIAKNGMDAGLNRIKVDKSEELGQPGAHGLDGLLGGEQALPVPDVGRVFAAGELANLLTNMATLPGTADGGLKGALIEFNLPPQQADFFVDGIRDGGLLLFVRTEDERAREAASILREHKAEQVVTATGQ